MERRALIALAALLTSCWASHERSPEARDAGAPADAGPVEACERAQVDLSARTELRRGPEGMGCHGDGLLGTFVGVTLTAGAMEIELDTCWGCEEPNACVLVVRGLHPEVARAAAGDLGARDLHDVWFELAAGAVNLRDTGLCDGPAPPECPLLFRAGVGDLAGYEDPRVDFSWDGPTCFFGDGACDEAVFELAVNGLDPISARRVGQGDTVALESFGELELMAASSASVRSPCTDEPPPAEWATWVRRP